MTRFPQTSFVLFATLIIGFLTVNCQKLNCTRPNEEYQCGSACQTTCETLGQTCPIINIKCNDDCYCIKDYARDSTGKCIPASDCPSSSSESA